jgi:hypothetical protein
MVERVLAVIVQHPVVLACPSVSPFSIFHLEIELHGAQSPLRAAGPCHHFYNGGGLRFQLFCLFGFIVRMWRLIGLGR